MEYHSPAGKWVQGWDKGTRSQLFLQTKPSTQLLPELLSRAPEIGGRLSERGTALWQPGHHTHTHTREGLAQKPGYRECNRYRHNRGSVGCQHRDMGTRGHSCDRTRTPVRILGYLKESRQTCGRDRDTIYRPGQQVTDADYHGGKDTP